MPSLILIILYIKSFNGVFTPCFFPIIDTAPLIKSISGIRGTIGNRKGEDLTKEDIVLYTRSFILWLENEKLIINNKVVVGRDARTSGKMVEDLVLDTLIKMGVNVVCLGSVSYTHLTLPTRS